MTTEEEIESLKNKLAEANDHIRSQAVVVRNLMAPLAQEKRLRAKQPYIQPGRFHPNVMPRSYPVG